MPNTTNYSFPTPADSDLVKNGADAIRDLGDAVDTAMNTALGTKKAGMVLLNTTSFSGVTSQSINDVFSATYDNYKIVFSIVGANNVDKRVSLRLRVSGSDVTTSYDSIFISHSFGTLLTWQQALVPTDRTHLANLGNASDMPSAGQMEIYSPFLVDTTEFVGQSVGTKSGDYYGMSLIGGHHATSTSYTGLTLLTSDSSNMSGTISIYGVNK